MTRQLLLATSALLASLATAPAAAQDAGGERVMMVNIRPGEACPASTDPDTIVVCDEIEDPYRIPTALRQGDSPQNRSWADRVRDMENVGATGPGSCSNVGGGSELGCTAQFIADNVEERENGPNVRFSEQIAAARAERLATIDADAAMTQARVEVLERAYMERLEAEREALLPGDEVAPAEVVDPAAIPARPLTTPRS
ncbi:MAG: hypothetical protein ABIT10_09800 [Alteraurantiacibacter sp.]